MVRYCSGCHELKYIPLPGLLGRLRPETKINQVRVTYTQTSMLTRPERRAVVIMVGVILLLAALYAGMMVLFPDGGAVFYQDDRADGTLVYLEGVVFDTKITSTGGHLIVNVSGVDVFVPNGGSESVLLPGDQVRVLGTVDTYAGKKEITTNGISDITILV